VHAIEVTGLHLTLCPEPLIVAVDAVGGISKPYGAIGLHHHIIGAVQPLALVAVRNDRDAAMLFGAGDTAIAVLAGDKPAVPIDGIAVCITGGKAKHADSAGRLVPAHDAVIRDIAPDEVSAGWEVRRTLDPAASRVELFQARAYSEK
jgi:hypothetical protein